MRFFRGAIRLFTVRGIEVRLDYSWFIIFVLVTWSLSTEYFPGRYHWAPPLYWAVGAVTAICFFLSVLLHELSHSFVAQANGIAVPRITLFIFGGAAQIAEEPKSAREEFLMALAGPAMSLVIALVSGGLWWLVRERVELLGALLGWLALINVMLAVFNLIPGFPLDGGRVLRAVAWGITGDLRLSTRIAAGMGQLFAFLFILWGVYMLVIGRETFNGIWMAFIGWFLLQAATQSGRRQAVQGLLQGHVAREVMRTDCPFIESRTTVHDLVHRHILPTGHRCFPVMENGSVAGIVTLHNVKTIPPDQWLFIAVGSVMVPASALKAVSPSAPLNKLLELMAGEGVNQVPVVEGGRFIGMVTREGLMDFMRAKSELRI